MANIVIMPKQGLQMTEGTILKWLVDEGGKAEENKPLFEMETDKLTITIDANCSGTLLKIIRGVGDVVPITEPIAVIGQPGEDISALLPAAPAASTPAAPAAAATAAPAAPSGATRAPGERVFVTPRAKTVAAERGVDLQKVPGSGPDGLVIERDVLSYKEEAAPAASPLARKLAELEGVNLKDVSGSGARGKIYAGDLPAKQAAPTAARGEKLIPLTGMRKVVAQRMCQSLTEMAQACHTMHVNMTEAVRLREQLKAANVKVSYNDIVIRCVAKALTEFPMMNSSLTDKGILLKEYVNVGMAVAVDGGLIVPVIPDADLKTLPELAAKSAELAKKAKENKLSPDEYTGGTFTVSNLGMFGVDEFTAIINPPEVGILGVGKMEKRAVAEGDTIVARNMMTICLTYDHRVVDGAPAAQFLARVRQLLETPALLL